MVNSWKDVAEHFFYLNMNDIINIFLFSYGGGGGVVHVKMEK